MSNNLPEWTAQAFVAAGAVFLLISAYWMGVYVPNAKELSDDFESEISFDGDMTLLNQGKFATLQGDYNPENGLDTFAAADGTNAVIVVKADSSGSDDEKTLYNFNASAYSDQERTNRILTFSDTNNYVDRTTYETKSADDEDAEFAHTAWNPNNLPKQEDTMLPNPFVSTHMNTYKYVGEEEVDGIDCYKYEVDEAGFPYSSASVLALKDTFDGALPEGVAGQSAGEMVYKETIWVSKDTGQVADRYLDVIVNFVPDARLAGSFQATESLDTNIVYEGTLDGANITADRRTFSSGPVFSGVDNATGEARTYMNASGTLFVSGEDDPRVNSTFTIDTHTLQAQGQAPDGTYIAGGSTFFTVGATCTDGDAHNYANLFLTTHVNTYTCLEQTTIPGYLIPLAGLMGNTPVNHYQSVENEVYYGKLDQDADGIVDTPTLPVFDSENGYCMNPAACPDRQWSSLIAYALTLTALGESALQIPINSTSSMDLPALGNLSMVENGTALMGSQYHPIVQAGFTDIDAYAAGLGLTNPDGSAITYANMPFVIDETASVGFQLPQLGGEDCLIGSNFHPLVQASLSEIPGYTALCIDTEGNMTLPEICGVVSPCNFTDSQAMFGSDFHPFFQESLAEVEGYEAMPFHTEGGMSLPYPGDLDCLSEGNCTMGSSITHPLVIGLLQQVMVGLGQDANNYATIPWVLSDNMTIPVPDNGTLFAQGKALMGSSFHPWVVTSPVDGSGLSSLSAMGVDYTAYPWVTIDAEGNNLTKMLPNMTEGFAHYFWLKDSLDGYTTNMSNASFGNQSNPADPNSWDGAVNVWCDISKMDWSTYTCIPMYEWVAHPIPFAVDTYVPYIDFYHLPKTSVADLPVMLDSKYPLMESSICLYAGGDAEVCNLGAPLPVLAPQTLDMYMDYEENVWLDPVTGTVLDQDFNITVSIKFPWGTKTVAQSIIVEYTDAQKLASSGSRWNTEFAYTYFPGSPLSASADTSKFVIMTLKGGYAGTEKTEAIETIEDTTSSLRTGEQTVPTLLIGLAMVSLAGGFYTYYQGQGGSFGGMGMDELDGGEEEAAPSMAVATEEDTSEAESADDDSDGDSSEEDSDGDSSDDDSDDNSEDE